MAFETYADAGTMGLLPDTGADVSALLLSAFNTARDNEQGLYLRPGVYRVDTPTTLSATTGQAVKLKSDGYGAVITNTANTWDVLLTVGGSREFEPAGSFLTADVAAGSLTLPGYGQSAGAGDLVVISTADREIWRNMYFGSSGVPRGELCLVRSVSGSGAGRTLHLDRPMREAYSAALTKMLRIYTPAVRLENIHLVRNTDYGYGLFVQNALDFEVVNCSVRGARHIGMHARWCYRGKFWKNRITDAYSLEGFNTHGDCYGISLATCRGVETVANKILSGKHSYTEGGWEPADENECRGNLIHAYIPDVPGNNGIPAFHYHQNVVRARALFNTVHGGISAPCGDVLFENNWVWGDGRYPLSLTPYFNSDYFIVRNNTFYADGNNYGYIAPIFENLHVGYVEYSGNRHRGGLFGFSVNTGNTGDSIGVLRIDNNDIESSSYNVIVQGAIRVDRYVNTGRGNYPQGIYYNPTG